MSRTGPRRLNRPINRRLDRSHDRSLESFAIHLKEGRRPPPINWLRVANRTIRQYVRQREASLKRHPEDHPIDAWNRLQRERKREAQNREISAALNRVYGDAPKVGRTEAELRPPNEP
jgi:hypothetical protein